MGLKGYILNYTELYGPYTKLYGLKGPIYFRLRNSDSLQSLSNHASLVFGVVNLSHNLSSTLNKDWFTVTIGSVAQSPENPEASPLRTIAFFASFHVLL